MKKKLLTVALIALLCACGGNNNPSSSSSSSFSDESISSEVISTETQTNVEDFTFETTSLGQLSINSDGGITITKYVCKRDSTLNVVIPETYTPIGSGKTYKITRIGDNAFHFAGGIKTVTLSKEIKGCASNAFEGCSTLLGIYVEEGNTVYSSRNDLLYSKDGKTLISGPNGKEEVLIDASTESIADSAFSNNRTKTFVFEEGVKTIGNRAFEKTKKAQSITLPNSVETIGEYAFANCDFKELNLGNSIKELPSYSIYQCPSLQSLSVPGSVKTIKYSAIGDNQHLSTLIINEGVEEVENYGIGFNTNLKQLTLPTSLKVIGDYGFISSLSLVTVTIPEGLEKIGTGAFSHSTALETIHISSTVKEIGQGITQYCTSFEEFIVDSNNIDFVVSDSSLYTSDMKRLLAVPQYYGEPGYHTYTVPSTVEHIDNFAFNYSVRISKVILPAGLISLGAGAFANSAVREIEFLGTTNDWESIEKTAVVEENETPWNLLCGINQITCSNGTVTITQEEVN